MTTRLPCTDYVHLILGNAQCGSISLSVINPNISHKETPVTDNTELLTQHELTSDLTYDPAGGTSPSLPTPGRRSAPVSIPRSHPTPPDPVPPPPAPRSAAAENIGLSLLRRFPERRLPKASDLVWLVGEDQVPQSVSRRAGLDSWRWVTGWQWEAVSFDN